MPAVEAEVITVNATAVAPVETVNRASFDVAGRMSLGY